MDPLAATEGLVHFVSALVCSIPHPSLPYARSHHPPHIVHGMCGILEDLPRSPASSHVPTPSHQGRGRLHHPSVAILFPAHVCSSRRPPPRYRVHVPSRPYDPALLFDRLCRPSTSHVVCTLSRSAWAHPPPIRLHHPAVTSSVCSVFLPHFCY